jgi:peptide/nickel transport system substrate-binding protein
MKRSLALALAALLLAGCTKTVGTGTPGTSPARGHRHAAAHELIIGDTQDISGLNPHLVTALSLGNIAQLTMAYLVRYGADSRPVPELATVVPTQANGGIGKDGLTITWHLRKGVKWADGAPFDADDVVFSTNAVNNPKNNEVGRDGWDLITKVDEPDKYTVVYHLRKPYSAFLPTFFGSAGANPCLLPKHILGNLPNINDAPYNSKPVGIGPYRVTEWVRSDHVTMEANPYYWRGQPKIKKIVYKFIPDRNTALTQLETGEIDLWPYVTSAYYDRVKALRGIAVNRMPGYLYVHVDMNTTHAALRDPVVRAAMRLATDRRTIQQKLNHGTGIVQESQITPSSPLYRPIALVPFNLPEANRLLDAAGWKRGPDGVRAKNGVRLALTVASGTGSPDVDQRIELLRANWQQIGITLSVQHYSQALFFGPFEQGGILFNGKWDVTTYAWQQTPDGDLRATNGCKQIPPNGENVTRLCDAQLEAILAREAAAYDEAPRAAAITDGVQRISVLVPYYVLYIQDNIHAYTSALTDWKPNATTPFDDLMNADTGA